MRSPLPAALLSETRVGFFVGGQWGSENAWIAELRAVGVNVYSPPCGLFRLQHEHCSQSRPHQLSRIDQARAPRRRNTSLTDEPACYSPLCQRPCQRPYVPFLEDNITSICRDMAKCLSGDQTEILERMWSRHCWDPDAHPYRTRWSQRERWPALEERVAWDHPTLQFHRRLLLRMENISAVRDLAKADRCRRTASGEDICLPPLPGVARPGHVATLQLWEAIRMRPPRRARTILAKS
jgi:hypothetical protein